MTYCRVVQLVARVPHPTRGPF